jgi:hypothetical protein
MAKTRTRADLSYIAADLRHLAFPVADLVPDPDNARTHPEDNLEVIIRSLKEFGQDVPIVIQKGTRRIIKGNGRYLAAVELGWQYLAAVQVEEESEARLIARAIADNRAGELAQWDDRKLHELLTKIREADGLADAEAVGFTADDLRKLGESLAEDDADAELAGTEEGDGGGGDEGDDDHYAGMRGYSFQLTTQQELDVREAVKHAKRKFQVVKTADAIWHICREYMDTAREPTAPRPDQNEEGGEPAGDDGA